LWDFVTNMCKISYKFVRNESCQFFANICKPNLAYFTSILQKIGSKWFQKTCPTKLYYFKVTKNVKCAIENICNYKYL
jgi:hypothetical protein